MLAEHFVSGNMDNGGDFGTGRLDWEWDNVMMLPAAGHMNRKLHTADWSEEPVMVASGGSGIPGVSATPAPTSMPGGSRYPPEQQRNSLDDGGSKLGAGGGVFSSVVKHESEQHSLGRDIDPCLDLTRSKPDRKSNGVIAAEKLSSNSKDFFLGLSGGAASGGKGDMDKNIERAAVANGDAETGLKLGLKRTYTPDSLADVNSSAGATATTATTATTTTATTTTTTTNKGGSPGKKPRASANHTPRCQVEGCKTDLSLAKDYHRRHKVCAMHSKSAKVSVNSIEQRFCQQCSRFHVLAEFDEGKRSCRRRLAGHNERRRKPQPDPMALTTAALSPYQAGFMRLAHERLLGYGTPLSYLGVDNLHGKLAWPRFGSVDDHHTGLASSSNISRPERFFMLFPPRKGPAILNSIGHHGVHQFMQGSGSMGQNLTLSSPPASGVYATGIGPPHNAAGMSDSGRALSLLSSQPWTASPSPHDSMEQLMSESRAPFNSQQQQQQSPSYSGTSPVRQPRSYGSPQVLAQQVSQGSLAVVALDGRNATQAQQQQQGGGGGGGGSFLPGINNYENHTVLTLLQESELRNLQDQQQQQHAARPTIDLMQMSTTQPPSAVVIQQQQQQQSSSDFQVLKPYGSGLYDPHQL